MTHGSVTTKKQGLFGPPMSSPMKMMMGAKSNTKTNNHAVRKQMVEALVHQHTSSFNCSPLLDINDLIERVTEALPDAFTTEEMREVIINTCSSKMANHYNYDTLAASLFLEGLYEQTPASFSDAMSILHNEAMVLNDVTFQSLLKNKEELDAMIDHSRDRLLTFFGLKTLCNGYLLRHGKRLVERPQYLFMRVAVSIHLDDLKRVQETYNLLSSKCMIHATPTLFNAGTIAPQNSSCFLLGMPKDSLDSIFGTLSTCSQISKHAGGIGMAIHNIRAKGSQIKSCNGTSSGIVPMLRMFNAASRYVNQAGKRNGSIAVYLEPWHADIEDFLELRKNYGNEEQRTRDLFTALWVPDLFMKRVNENGMWSLMSPDVSPDLHKVWGDAFEKLYHKYETEGKFIRQIRARDLWEKIIESQLETGLPYMLYKDHVNSKTNHQHLGTIQCSNLCTEIMEYTNENEVAVCNLCSIGLPAFVDNVRKTFDFDKLHHVARVATRNLDLIIDRNFYPVPQAENSNMRHRPIGIGVQGLADVFVMLEMPFDSQDAAKLNAEIFETIYHAAMTESCVLAQEKGPFETFQGCPLSKGLFQFDMWGVKPASARYDWAALRNMVVSTGVRNSLLVAPMPTASTSQILGYNEAFEPFTSNIYKRNTLAGEFIVLNRHLVHTLESLGLWNEQMKNQIILNNGSVQHIEQIPSHIRSLFKTSWEIKQRTLIDLAASRGPYICQSQSLNLFMEEPDYQKLTSMHFYAWRAGLKTGMYYLRTRPKARAQQFTLDPTALTSPGVHHIPDQEQILVCTRENGCVTCSS